LKWKSFTIITVKFIIDTITLHQWLCLRFFPWLRIHHQICFVKIFFVPQYPSLILELLLPIGGLLDKSWFWRDGRIRHSRYYENIWSIIYKVTNHLKYHFLRFGFYEGGEGWQVTSPKLTKCVKDNLRVHLTWCGHALGPYLSKFLPFAYNIASDLFLHWESITKHPLSIYSSSFVNIFHQFQTSHFAGLPSLIE